MAPPPLPGMPPRWRGSLSSIIHRSPDMAWWWRFRARLGYALARRLFHWRWLMQKPGVWRWMEGQFSRMATLGHVPAQSFYGHVLLFRGRGLGAREEGLRLLRLAAQSGDSKAAYQLGVTSLAGS